MPNASTVTMQGQPEMQHAPSLGLHSQFSMPAAGNFDAPQQQSQQHLQQRRQSSTQYPAAGLLSQGGTSMQNSTQATHVPSPYDFAQQSHFLQHHGEHGRLPAHSAWQGVLANSGQVNAQIPPAWWNSMLANAHSLQAQQADMPMWQVHSGASGASNGAGAMFAPLHLHGQAVQPNSYQFQLPQGFWQTGAAAPSPLWHTGQAGVQPQANLAAQQHQYGAAEHAPADPSQKAPAPQASPAPVHDMARAPSQNRLPALPQNGAGAQAPAPVAAPRAHEGSAFSTFVADKPAAPTPDERNAAAAMPPPPSRPRPPHSNGGSAPAEDGHTDAGVAGARHPVAAAQPESWRVAGGAAAHGVGRLQNGEPAGPKTNAMSAAPNAGTASPAGGSALSPVAPLTGTYAAHDAEQKGAQSSAAAQGDGESGRPPLELHNPFEHSSSDTPGAPLLPQTQTGFGLQQHSMAAPPVGKSPLAAFAPTAKQPISSVPPGDPQAQVLILHKLLLACQCMRGLAVVCMIIGVSKKSSQASTA